MIQPGFVRLWDMKTGNELDKDVFRQDLGDLADAYTEVARRLGGLARVKHRRRITKTDLDQLIRSI